MLPSFRNALLLLLLATTMSVSAQSMVDSLKQRLAHTTNKRERLSLYLKLCHVYSDGAEAGALRESAGHLDQLAVALGDADARCYAHYYQVRADYLEAPTQKVMAALDEVIREAEGRKINPLLLTAYKLKAGHLQMKGDPEGAVALYRKTLPLPGQSGEDMAYTWSLLAAAYESKGDYLQVLECLNHTYEYVKSKNDPATELMFNQNMGLVYQRLKQPAKARPYFEKNLAYLRKIKHKRNQAISLTNIGHTHYDEGNYPEALACYEQALALDQANGITTGRHQRLLHIANAHKQLQEPDKAEPLLVSAREMAQKAQDMETLLNANKTLAAIYTEKGLYDQALEILLQSKGFCNTLKRREHLLSVYRGLATNYEKTGQHELAYEAHRHVYAIRDSLYNENSLKQFQELQTRYETTKKEQEIAMLEKNNQIRDLEYRQLLIDKQAQQQAAELRDLRQAGQIKQLKISELQQANENIRKAREIENLAQDNQAKDLQLETQALTLRTRNLEVQRQRFLLAGIVIFVLISGIAAYLLYSRSRLQMKNKAMMLEQKLLRSQMNPHFIFNSLASIQNFLFENEPRATAIYLSKFSKLMRHTLENSREDTIPLSREVQLLENYLQLQELRFTHKFKWEITVSPDIDVEETMVPPMFAQPFIENSLEHGILHKADQGVIRVSFSIREGKLLLMVADNGGGIAQGKQMRLPEKKEYKSLATQITQERLQLLSQKYRQSFELAIQELTGEHNTIIGTQVTISLPFQS